MFAISADSQKNPAIKKLLETIKLQMLGNIRLNLNPKIQSQLKPFDDFTSNEEAVDTGEFDILSDLYQPKHWSNQKEIESPIEEEYLLAGLEDDSADHEHRFTPT
jgi:superfamily I DNA and/or RNA helicase